MENIQIYWLAAVAFGACVGISASRLVRSSVGMDVIVGAAAGSMAHSVIMVVFPR